MAPTKFGLFKSRSKDQSDQPSVENLLQSSGSSDTGLNQFFSSSPFNLWLSEPSQGTQQTKSSSFSL